MAFADSTKHSHAQKIAVHTLAQCYDNRSKSQHKEQQHHYAGIPQDCLKADAICMMHLKLKRSYTHISRKLCKGPNIEGGLGYTKHAVSSSLFKI